MSLIELIGAIVVFGILLSLSAMVINYFMDANYRSEMSSLANTEGYLAIRTIEEELDDLSPTTFGSCPGVTCWVAQKEYEYQYDEGTNSIELVVFPEPLEYRIEMNNGVLYLDGIPYVFNGFTLTSESELSFETIGTDAYIELTLYLSVEDLVFEYVMTYSYEITNVPGT